MNVSVKGTVGFMKILIAPDSFKGTLSAEKAVKIISHAARRVFDDYSFVNMPLANGGEGTAALLTSFLGGRLETVTVEGPFGKPCTAHVGFVDGGRCAIIESSEAIGLPLAGKRANPEKTSSYGVGQMISYATSKGAHKVILTLGGSSTNDCGAGMLSAMGISFVDICGNRFSPVGGTLHRVETVEFNQAFSKYSDVDFTLLCDVKNPLLGPSGCAAVFAAQKGADASGIKRLEDGAVKFDRVIKRVTGTNYAAAEGAGAAGGIAYGAMAFLGAKVASGIDTVLDVYKFAKAARECDLVVTGEGSFDSQSLMGKAVGGVLERLESDTPCVIFCGRYDGTAVPENVSVVPIANGQSDEEAQLNASDNLLRCAEQFFAQWRDR